MINSLYKTFQRWSDRGSVWIISDPHFEDEDCLLMNPNWISPDQYIENLNKKVHKGDTLICLGDVGNIEWIRKIKASRKILIKGNHDDKGDQYYIREIRREIYDSKEYTPKQIREELMEKYPGYRIEISRECYEFHSPFTRYYVYIDNMLFDEVYSGALFIADKILLSHEPIFGLPFCVNIHGHHHNGEHRYYDEYGCKHINLAADVCDYEPINLGKEIKNGLFSDIPQIHRITIDSATERKNNGKF